MEKHLCDAGVAGLGVMGANLARNMARHKFKVAVFNRTNAKTHGFMEKYAAEGDFFAADDLRLFTQSITRPRKIFVMIKAGADVDEFIELILPHLEEGDILIDGGNSFHKDTARREEYLKSKGVSFIGCGVSGGEEGALLGPSMMPGGDFAAWRHVETLMKTLAAKYGSEPCCAWMSSGGSGHFVKMVHNGIEYADMQLIAETCFIMKRSLGMTNNEVASALAMWNSSDLESYLVSTAEAVLRKRDSSTGGYLIDSVLDSAGEKGTGRWTAETALELGVPASMITQSVFARFISTLKSERVNASKLLAGETLETDKSAVPSVETLRDALYTAKLCAYAQGFAVLRAASQKYSWNLDYAAIASVWRAGCIIRAGFLNEISNAFNLQKGLENLLIAPYFIERTRTRVKSLRRTVAFAAESGVPAPCHADALSYFDSYTTADGTAGMIQALRDCFGAHTFVRIDDSEGKSVHADWLT